MHSHSQHLIIFNWIQYCTKVFTHTQAHSIMFNCIQYSSKDIHMHSGMVDCIHMLSKAFIHTQVNVGISSEVFMHVWLNSKVFTCTRLHSVPFHTFSKAFICTQAHSVVVIPTPKHPVRSVRPYGYVLKCAKQGKVS